MKKTKIKVIAVILSLVALICIIFTAVSYLYFDRSVMATFSEWYLLSTDRDAMFDTEEGFGENFLNQQKKQQSGEKYEIPSSVKLSDSAEMKEKHGMQVYYLSKDKLNESDTVVFYFHGGAFINDITEEHWSLIDYIADKTGLPIIVPLYPKLPKYSCEDASQALLKLYKETAKKDNIERICFVGDSSGGTLALSLAKQLRDNEAKKQPDELILIAPWLDLSLKTDGIEEIAENDPMLGLYGLKKLGKLWADKRAITNPTVSPIYGSNENLGDITIFASTKDMLYPDIVRYSEILTKEEVSYELIVEQGLNHPYVLFPTPEARKAKAKIAEIIVN